MLSPLIVKVPVAWPDEVQLVPSFVEYSTSVTTEPPEAPRVADTASVPSPGATEFRVGAPGTETSAETTMRKFDPKDAQEPPAFDDVSDKNDGVGVIEDDGEVELFFQAIVLPALPDITMKYWVDAERAVPGLDDVAKLPSAHGSTEAVKRSATLLPGWPLDEEYRSTSSVPAVDEELLESALRTVTVTPVSAMGEVPVENDCAAHDEPFACCQGPSTVRLYMFSGTPSDGTAATTALPATSSAAAAPRRMRDISRCPG